MTYTYQDPLLSRKDSHGSIFDSVGLDSSVHGTGSILTPPDDINDGLVV